MEKMNEVEKIHAMNAILDRIARMNDQIEINTRKLNDAIKEMRGLVGFVRPLAKKNAWYGEEIETKPVIDIKYLETEEVHEKPCDF